MIVTGPDGRKREINSGHKGALTQAFHVKTPEGHLYHVHAPSDATPEEILNHVQNLHDDDPPQGEPTEWDQWRNSQDRIDNSPLHQFTSGLGQGMVNNISQTPVSIAEAVDPKLRQNQFLKNLARFTQGQPQGRFNSAGRAIGNILPGLSEAGAINDITHLTNLLSAPRIAQKITGAIPTAKAVGTSREDPVEAEEDIDAEN
jgi:hypothetical protein